MTKLVIFDFDDTLVDNKTLDYESFKHISRKLNLFMFSHNEIIQMRNKGLLAKDIICRMISRSQKKHDVEYCLEVRNKFLQSVDAVNFLRLRPEAKKTLQILRRKGTKIVLTTLRRHDRSVKIFLKRSKISKYFDAIYSSGDIRLNLDTKDRMVAILVKALFYHSAMRDFRIRKSQAIAVGNSAVDMLAASLMHLKALQVSGSYQIQINSNNNNYMHKA